MVKQAVPSKAALRAILNSPNAPDPPKAQVRYVGRSGRSLCNYLVDLFHLNEEVQLKYRKSDSALQKIVCEEFVKIPEVVKRIEEGQYTINYYRTYYNRGRLVPSRPPQKISFRYGFGSLAGTPVNLRTGNRELTPEEVVAHIKRYRGNFWPILHDLPRTPKLVKYLLAEGLISDE